MLALYKLQAKQYFSNVFARIDFITTVMFLIVIGSLSLMGISNISDITAKKEAASSINITVIASITMLMVMNSALYAFGFSFFEMKSSVLLKRIGATKISKPMAIASFLAWGSTTMFFVLCWIGLWVGIFQIPFIASHTNYLLYIAPHAWANFNYGGMIVSVIIMALAFYAISFFFVSISKNTEIYNILVTFYFFVIAFLGGALTPTSNREWMTYISYISPLGWGTQVMTNSMYGLQVFHLGGYATNIPEVSVDALHATGGFVFPIVFGLAATGASIKTFKWD